MLIPKIAGMGEGLPLFMEARTSARGRAGDKVLVVSLDRGPRHLLTQVGLRIPYYSQVRARNKGSSSTPPPQFQLNDI